MANKNTSVVKINSELLREVEKFIVKDKNKLRFVNRKQFIDLAVYEYLKKLSKNEKS